MASPAGRLVSIGAVCGTNSRVTRVSSRRHGSSCASQITRRGLRTTRRVIFVSALEGGDIDPNGSNKLVDPTRRDSSGLNTSTSCAWCEDSGASDCKTCSGAGVLSPGGFHSKNHVDVKTVVGTNWTAMIRTKGWRHFEATEVLAKDKSVKLTATCDRAIYIWVNLEDLKDRNKWSAGWKQKEELEWSGDVDDAKGQVASPKAKTTCPKCEGVGKVPCDRKGCKAGVERIKKNQAIIEKTNESTRRALNDARRRAAEGDENAAAFAQRAKQTLKATSKQKKSKREKRAERLGKGSKSNTNGDEDWGARARNKRDERLEAFVKGVKGNDKREDERQ